jgi:sec-independent protein translocase protein TatA
MIYLTLVFLPSLGAGEITLILLIILIFFGAKKIPELAKGFGRGIREFKDATKEVKKEIEDGVNDDTK